MREVWLHKPGIIIKEKAKALAEKYGVLGRGSKGFPKDTKGSPQVKSAAKLLLDRGWWNPRMRPLCDKPTDTANWVRRKSCFKRFAFYRYSPETGEFRIPEPTEDMKPWLESGEVSKHRQDASEFWRLACKAVVMLSTSLESLAGTDPVVIGSGLYRVTDESEFDNDWAFGVEDYHLCVRNLQVPVCREALVNPNPRDYLGFKYGPEVGPMAVELSRILPVVSSVIPASIQASDRWVFNGE